MRALADDELVFSKAKGNWSVRYKQYLRDHSGEERGAKPMSIVVGPFTQEGTDEVKQILGDGKAFTFPKPTGLISRFLQYVDPEDEPIILDFFAGSGTTAHAVLKLNAEDGGRRRFILVSSTEATVEAPEKNLCRDVCARRVRRVIEGYGETPGLGGDFAYLRCRRIAPGRLVEIEHAQVWTALQMIHGDTLEAFTAADFLRAGDDEATPALVPAQRQAVNESAAAVIYSWQPETLRQRIRAGHVEHAAIPESLARRFGMKG